VQITNAGPAAVALTTAITGDFILQNQCPVALAAGSSCELLVSFAPSQPGVREGLLSISAGGAFSPTNITLTGTATSAMSRLVRRNSRPSPLPTPAPDRLQSTASQVSRRLWQPLPAASRSHPLRAALSRSGIPRSTSSPLAAVRHRCGRTPASSPSRATP
jgi:hypothetical protein